MKQICKKCGIEKELEIDFYKHPSTLTGYLYTCKDCHTKDNKLYKLKNPSNYSIKHREYSKKYSKTHRESIRSHQKIFRKNNTNKIVDNALKRLYGISLMEYNKILEKQGYRCAICSTETPTRGNKFFIVDHNHITGTVRGLLCHKCNSAIAAFNVDLLGVSFICKAIDYINNKINVFKIDKTKKIKYENISKSFKTILRRYMLTFNEFSDLILKCEGRCSICNKVDSGKHDGSRLCIDHSHKFNTIRGILCDSCNRSLGLLQVDRLGFKLLQNAKQYILCKTS